MRTLASQKRIKQTKQKLRVRSLTITWERIKTAKPQHRVQFEQSKICEIINDLLERHPLSDICYGTEFIAFSQDKNGVSVKVRQGNQENTIHGRFLIGADGGSSAVRQQLGVEFKGSIYPERTVLVTTTFPFDLHIELRTFLQNLFLANEK